MDRNTVFPAFIRAEYDASANGFQQFERDAKASVDRAKRTFQASFTEIGQVIRSAIGGGMKTGGGIDLNVGQFRQAAAEARAYSAALAETLSSARNLAQLTGDTSQQTKLYLQALSAQVIEADRATRAADAQVMTYTRLQSALDGAASRTSALAGAFRDVYLEQARAARAEVVARQYQAGYEAVYSPGLSREPKSASASGAVFEAAARQADDLARAEERLARAADEAWAALERQSASMREAAVEAQRAREAQLAAASAFAPTDNSAQFNQQVKQFKEIAALALSIERGQGGGLNLNVDQYKQAAQSAQAQAIALREVATAAAMAANKNEDNSESTRLYVQAARAAAVEAEKQAAAAQNQASAMVQLQAQLARTASQTSMVVKNQQGYTNALFRGEDGARAARFASIQLGQQLQDITVSLAGGQNAFVVFAQQIPQAAFALQGFGGKIGAVAEFLSGPWGAVIFGAVTAIGLLSQAFDKSGDAAKEAEKAAKEYEKALESLNESTAASLQTQYSAQVAAYAHADALRDQAVAALEAKKAQLELAVATYEANRARSTGPGQGSDLAAMKLGDNAKAVDDLRKEIGEIQGQIDSATRSVNRTRAKFIGAEVEASLDPAQKAAREYQRTMFSLNEQLDKNTISEAEYARALTQAGKVRDAALEAARKSGKGKSEAEKEAANAAKEAAKAQRELEQMLDSLIQKFDPATAAALSYAEALAQIAELEMKGQFSKNPDENRYLAAKMRDKVEAAQIAKQVEEGKSRLSYGLQEGFKGVNEAALGVADTLEDGGRRAGEALRDEGLDAAQAIAQIIGGSFGSGLGKLIGVLQGLSSGNYNGVGGALGGMMTLLSGKAASAAGGGQNLGSFDALKAAIDRSIGKTGTFADGLQDVFAPLKDQLGKLVRSIGNIFGEGGNMSRTLGQLAGGATLGMAAGGLLGGSGSRAGSAIGGALGQVAGKALGKALGGTLGKVAGPLGSIAGGLVGGLVGGLFKKVKKGSATLGYDQYGNLSVAGTSGNNQDYIRGATNNANSIAGSLQDIASQLGGSLGGSVSVSIGRRKKNYVVDTTGSGRTKGAGTMKFKDEAEALRYAIQDAINDGVIQGLRAGTNRLIKGSGDLERQLEKAVKFENVFKSLKRELDPVGAAIDELNMEFEGLKKIFAEAGASAEEYSQLEQLYAIRRKEAVEAAAESMTSTLKSLLDDLTTNNEAYSLRDRLSFAKATYDPLAADLAAGKTVDYDAFAAAAQAMLEIQRELYGSQDQYFQSLQQVTGLTRSTLDSKQAQISAVSNASPFDASPNSSTSTATDNTTVVSAIGGLQGALLQALAKTNASLASLVANSGWFNFPAAATIRAF